MCRHAEISVVTPGLIQRQFQDLVSLETRVVINQRSTLAENLEGGPVMPVAAYLPRYEYAARGRWRELRTGCYN